VKLYLPFQGFILVFFFILFVLESSKWYLCDTSSDISWCKHRCLVDLFIHIQLDRSVHAHHHYLSLQDRISTWRFVLNQTLGLGCILNFLGNELNRREKKNFLGNYQTIITPKFDFFGYATKLPPSRQVQSVVWQVYEYMQHNLAVSTRRIPPRFTGLLMSTRQDETILH
jgi:hypothetical protein